MNTTITRSTTTALEPPLPGPEFQTKRAPLPDPGSIPIMLEVRPLRRPAGGAR